MSCVLLIEWNTAWYLSPAYSLPLQTHWTKIYVGLQPKKFRRVHWLLRISYVFDDVYLRISQSCASRWNIFIYTLDLSLAYQCVGTIKENHFSTCGLVDTLTRPLCVLLFLQQVTQQSTDKVWFFGILLQDLEPVIIFLAWVWHRSP